MMFDGAIAATLADTPDNSSEPAAMPETSPSADGDLTPGAGSSDHRQEIVFVDTQVQNYQQLLTGLPEGVEVVLLDGASDGLQVIANTLAGREGIDAIHILSHGDNGQVQLGSDWLDSASIAARSDLLAAIGQSLSEDGDILLYGCRLGADGAGVEFINSLASATGADIAASSDLTGAVDLGGDWELEYSSGAVETQSLDLSDYTGLLTAFSDSLDTDVGLVTSFNSTLGGVSYTYTFTAEGDAGDMIWQSGFGDGNSASMNLASGDFNFGTTERVTIARTDAADFTFSSLYINNSGGATITVGGYLDGVLVGSAQTVSTGAAGTLSFGAIGVDEVRISSTDFFNTNIDSFAGDTNPPAPPAPTITNATYDAATGVLTAIGTNMTTGDTIDASTLTLTGEGGSTYTLTDTSDVLASSATGFSVTLSATDRAALNQIFNKNGASSTGGTNFNLAAADDWDANVTSGDTSDATNTVTVSNVAAPTITDATYDASTGTMVVTGTGLLQLDGATNDIDVSKFTFTGEGGATYTLTDSSDVEISSSTGFTLTLSATDKAAINLILNQNGASSSDATNYNLAAAEDWNAGAEATVIIADLTDNGVTVSNVPDTTPPTASIVVADTALAAGETSLVTISFSEAVTGLTTDDFSVANGSLSGLSSADGGITWTATLTPGVDVEDASNLVTLDNSGVADLAGNAGSGSTDSNNYAIDTLRPTAAIVVADTALAAGETSLVTISFNEAVTGLTLDDLSVANGALSSLATADGGITWTATLTPSSDVEDASNLVRLDNSGVQDIAGNAGSGNTDSNNYAIDTLRPTANIVVADSALAAGETSLVTISFSEAITGLTSADFTVANGALSGLGSTDGGITWTATLTPSSDVEDASNLVTLDNTGVADSAGNAGSGNTDSNNYAIDTLRPSATIVVADSALAAGEISLVTISFSEAITGLTVDDFSVANGALSSLATADGGITWTATLTPSSAVEDASNLVTLDNSGVEDAAGNAGSGNTDSNNYAIDTLRPSATIVVADSALAAGETSLVTITFNEAVTGLTLDDFSVANGSLSGLASTDGGITWTATLTPSSDVEDASNLVALDNSGVEDAAGNAGSGNTDSNNYAIDTLAPTALSIEVPADGGLDAGALTFELVFNEAVSGVDIGDFSLLSTGNVIATLDSVQQIDASTYRVHLNGVAGNGSLSLVLNAAGSGIVDMAGNDLSAGFTGPGVNIATLSGDPEFRLQSLGANPAASALAVPVAPAAPPAPFDSALRPEQLFDPAGPGSGIPSLSSIFINNGAATPSVISQVFAGQSPTRNDGSGSGFLGFGGGDANGLGGSTLSTIFNTGPMPDVTPDLDLRSVFGAPTLGQQLQALQDSEQDPVNALALALGQVQPVEPNV